jgi:hypothetical protein
VKHERKRPLHGLKVLAKPKPAANPSLVAGKNMQQAKPVTLAKVWGK